MTSKARQIEMFLLPGMVGMILAIAAIYVFPMQQAMACGNGCDGGAKNYGGAKKDGGSCCGSLVNVQDNNIGNVKTGKVGNVENNNFKIGNVKTGDVLSGNKIKDINVLSKNDNNKILSYNSILSENLKDNNVVVNDNLNDLHNNIVKHNNVGASVLSDYFKQICGC